MKISYNWLKDYVDFTHSPQELANLLDSLGVGVDGLDEISAKWSKVFVGKVVICEPVSKTAHLTHCEVDIGTGETVCVVCGAPNVAAGQTIPLAINGAKMPDGFKIERRKMRGIESNGMICSEKELGISDEASGIMVLPDDLPIGSPLEDYYCKQDWVYDLEITFNRPDCLSHVGIAREIAAAAGLSLKMPSTNVVEEEDATTNKVSVEILAPDQCPRYSARIVEGVTIKPSPLWMQDRLRAVNVRPINNAVDVTNYILMEFGHPLHAFDYHLITDAKIIVRQAEKGEKFITLDEKEHTLADTDLLIADPIRGIALAGVMGGLNSEIKDDTRDVLLECAYFEPTNIRITSRDRGINTESSHRFERGVDPEMTTFALDRAAFLIKALAGGQVLKGIVDNYPKQWQPHTVSLRPERVNKILATDISEEKMVGYLEALGCEVMSSEKGVINCAATGFILAVTPPSWRHDLEREIDLIEEIARLYGYDNINTATRSAVPLVSDPEREHERQLINRFKQALVELGMYEAITFSLIPTTDAEWFPSEKQYAQLINPLSEEMALLRLSLGPSLLRTVQRNRYVGMDDIRLFEWSKCFWMENDRLKEEWRLGGILTGSVRPESWTDNTRELNLYDLKGVLEGFVSKISLDNAHFIRYHIPEYLITGGAVAIGKKETAEQIGLFGQIEPAIAKRYDLDFPVWFFELNGEKLLANTGRTPQYNTLPRFPAALRDLAFVVSETTEAEEIKNTILKSGGELLVEAKLFDLFRGEAVAKDKKSLAFHLTYRSSVRTLSDSEVDRSIKQIITAVGQDFGAVLRSL